VEALVEKIANPEVRLAEASRPQIFPRSKYTSRQLIERLETKPKHSEEMVEREEEEEKEKALHGVRILIMPL
jgi:hypothetical protein